MSDQLKLLVVEDNPAERALLETQLEQHPTIAYRMANSLQTAQQAIDSEEPDVVLLDLELPDARGLEAVAWLQRRNPQLALVVLSGFGADDLMVAAEAVGLGAQDFLAKGRLAAADLPRILQLAWARKRREVDELAGAVRDPLTKLPRLPVLEERFGRSVARSRRQRSELALLYIEVDGFSALEQAHGRDLGDSTLVGVAQRLASQLRRTDAIARLEGATFVAMVDGMKHGSDAYVVARKLLTVMRRPLDEETLPVPLRLSIGIASGLASARDFRPQLARAEAAMYEARKQGGDRYFAASDLVEAAC